MSVSRDGLAAAFLHSTEDYGLLAVYSVSLGAFSLAMLRKRLGDRFTHIRTVLSDSA